FTDYNTGWIVGANGAILHTTNGGVTFIEEEENNFTQPKEFLLQQNYPNPFNPSTKISWQSPVGSWQTLKVYDILGNEVATLVDEYRNSGNYEVDFNPASSIKNLASCVYFYQLRVGDYVETKKMILLK
ncbi:MAG: T9SS type A sorting domain-containing protein, partial [Ignavibacteriaceae bacterium]